VIPSFGRWCLSVRLTQARSTAKLVFLNSVEVSTTPPTRALLMSQRAPRIFVPPISRRLGCHLELLECVPERWSGVAVVRHEDPVEREQPRPGRLGRGVVVRDPRPCAVGFEAVAPDARVFARGVELFGHGPEGELLPARRGDHFADGEGGRRRVWVVDTVALCAFGGCEAAAGSGLRSRSLGGLVRCHADSRCVNACFRGLCDCSRTIRS